MTGESTGRSVVYRRSENGRCEICSRPGTNVHHRQRQGRPWNPGNLLRVCGAGNSSGCHGWIETNPTHARALGLIVHRDHDPLVMPVFARPALLWRGWWQPDDDGMWIPSDPPLALVDGGAAAIGAAVLALGEHLEGAA